MQSAAEWLERNDSISCELGIRGPVLHTNLQAIPFGRKQHQSLMVRGSSDVIYDVIYDVVYDIVYYVGCVEYEPNFAYLQAVGRRGRGRHCQARYRP